MLAKTRPDWKPLEACDKSSTSAMVKLERASAMQQDRATPDEVDRCSLWLAAPGGLAIDIVASTTMVRLPGLCRQTVARAAEYHQAAQPSPVIHATGSFGCASAMPSTYHDAPPMAHHR